jgi:hypothetical protein
VKGVFYFFSEIKLHKIKNNFNWNYTESREWILPPKSKPEKNLTPQFLVVQGNEKLVPG